MPKIIRRTISPKPKHTWTFNRKTYSVDKLIKETTFNHIGMIKTDTFDLSLRVWNGRNKYGREISISPAQVIRTIQQEHYERAMAADLRYPIILTSVEKSKFLVVDGYHRIVKAVFRGRKTLPFVFVGKDQLAKAEVRK